MMHTRRTRGAASTELVLLLTAVPVLLLTLATGFGHRVQGLFTGAGSRLDADRGATRAGGGAQGLAVEPAGIPTQPSRFCGIGWQPREIPFDTEFELADVDRIRRVLDELPATLRAAEITSVMRTDEANAGYDPSDRSLLVGQPLLSGEDGFNDYMAILTGANPRVSLERVLYHELVHGYHHQHPEVAAGFLSLKYAGKYASLRNDPRLEAATRVLLVAQYELTTLYGRVPVAADGRFDIAALEQILFERPDLRERIFTASRALTAILHQHGLPSRYVGDAHAGGDPGQSLASGGAEYLAIVLDTARYDPAEFQRWRRLANDEDPGNDILSPEEIRWVDEHRELME